ncbi:MAG: O-antigen ligase family protein [bacterium]|nr:O-antigen ligase family protein [bacterium]
MKKLLGLLGWLDNNLIKILIMVYTFLMPLYPKFPLVIGGKLMIVNYTYIAIRMEDLFMAILVAVFFMQLMRKKVVLNKKFLILFLIFWGAITASLLWGIFPQETVIYKHLGLLHTARRLEYMIIFFMVTSSIRTKNDFYFYLNMVFLALAAVICYGIGQKYFGLPAVQTMNPEFAKGHLLYLTEEARVSSTFAGHYDLAAYLVLLIPILLGAFYSYKRKLYALLFVGSLLLIFLTASRISFIAYIISAFGFLIFLKKPKSIIIVIILSIALSFTTKNLSSRFLKTFQIKQIFINENTGQVVVPQKINSKELPAGTYYVDIQPEGKKVNVEDATRALLNQTLLDSIKDEASKSGIILTSSEAARIAATMEANLTPVNTVVSDISFSTRLQVEWPRAIQSFLKNPILGTGASSITESTDSDYFRWIGEFGLAGTLAFLYILFSIAKFVFDQASKMKNEKRYVYYGFLFGLGGLFINASYIDVFEASKVAYNFWFIAGIFVGSLMYSEQSSEK